MPAYCPRSALLIPVAIMSVFLATFPASARTNVWDSEMSFGYDLNRGNSDTEAFRLGAKSKNKTDRDEFLCEAHYNYGETDGVKSVDNARAVADYNSILTDRFYINLKAEYSYDELADVDYRVLVGPPSPGYNFIHNERTRLGGEIGAAYLWEEVGGVARDAPTLRLKQRLDHRFSEAVTLFQLVEYTPELEAGNRYLVRAEAGLDSALAYRLHLRLYAIDRYDSRPAAGTEKNDLSLNVVLVLKV